VVVTLDGDAPREVPWLHADIALRTIDGALYALEPEQTGRGRLASRVRVQIEYEVELYGALKKIHLPFIIGVFADLSGDRAEPLPPPDDRKLVQIDRDNFESLMKSARPRLSLRVPYVIEESDSEMHLEVGFESLDDFRPWNVVRQIEPLRQRLEARRRLNDFQTHVIGDAKVQSILEVPFGQAENRNTWAELDADGFARTDVGKKLLSIGPGTEFWGRSVMSGVPELARQMRRATHEFSGVYEAISRALTDLDAALSRQLDVILHHEKFQQLESAWLGLHHLVTNTETSEMLKIRVLNVSKKELQEALVGLPYETLIFKKVYEDEYGTFGGEPYGLLVGDFAFDQSEGDIAILDAMAEVCAAAHAPFVAALSPRFVGTERWPDPFDSTSVGRALLRSEHAAWQSFRDSERARYIGLTLPGFLARPPYGAQHDFDAEFQFSESAGSDSADYVWGNAAYVMATNISAAFARYHWCARITGADGGGASQLPVHLFPAAAGVQPRSTEIVLSDRQEFELSGRGLMPLMSLKGTGQAAFFSTRPLRRYPGEPSPRLTDVNDDWRRLLPCCRFLHYIKCIVRDRLGSFGSAEELQSYLQRWIADYVDGDPLHRSDDLKARRPLASAELSVEGSPDSPTWYVRLRLLPQYQDAGSFMDTLPLEFVTIVPNGGSDTQLA
jgi:type VI secretion system protein ImpC